MNKHGGKSKALAKPVGRILAKTTGAAGAVGVTTGLVSTFGAASTGTAISTLSGAAATKATLAWFGGGALAAGGFGVAGGAIVLAGIGVAGGYGAKKLYDHFWKK